VRVLISVCEPSLARRIGGGLKEEGHFTELAPDGEVALDRLADDLPFDLLILDAELARPSGLEILTALRAAQIDTPALLLTGSAASGDIVSGLNRSADAILPKPFRLRRASCPRALLRRRSAYRSPRLTLGDLTLDPAAHRVTRSGRRIPLSAREYAVLEYLLRNPGQVLTRDMIAEHVWGPDYDAASNIVDVYVGYLRRKLDGEGDRPLLRTIRGVGYMLDLAR
jgi:DNA-binding response OmpR family regulator